LQIGLLLSIPTILSGIFEPILGILADIRKRHLLVLAGGVLFGVSLFLTAASPGFGVLLLSFILFYPASGAFVSLSQAELMDHDPLRKDQNMARWTLAGAAGAVAGPLALGLVAGLGAGWRDLYFFSAAAAAGVLGLAARFSFPAFALGTRQGPQGSTHSFREGLRGAIRALKRGTVLRWLALLEFANPMLDVLFGFLALFLVEVAGVSPGEAALGVTFWTGSEIMGDLLLIPLLDRMDGLRYLRISAATVCVLFPLFLVSRPIVLKLVLMATIGLIRAGWYAILQARLYESLPGQSGVALALGNIAGLAGALIPLGLGVIAEKSGLLVAMWMLLAAPLALLLGLLRQRRWLHTAPS
jgi:FSR family fosmidomycin resistance protein-like MFS transporter